MDYDSTTDDRNEQERYDTSGTNADVNTDVNEVQTDLASARSMEKVRDILFGNQMREQERKLSQLDARLRRDTDALREEVRKRLDVLEDYIREELEALGSRIKREEGSRSEADDALSAQVDEATKQLERRLSQLGDQTSEAQRGLRQQLLDQSRSLNDDLQRRFDEAINHINQSIGKQRTQQVDRATLSTMLMETAMRISEGGRQEITDEES